MMHSPAKRQDRAEGAAQPPKATLWPIHAQSPPHPALVSSARTKTFFQLERSMNRVPLLGWATRSGFIAGFLLNPKSIVMLNLLNAIGRDFVAPHQRRSEDIVQHLFAHPALPWTRHPTLEGALEKLEYKLRGISVQAMLQRPEASALGCLEEPLTLLDALYALALDPELPQTSNRMRTELARSELRSLGELELRTRELSTR